MNQQDINNAEFAALYVAGIWDMNNDIQTCLSHRTCRLERLRKDCSPDFLEAFDKTMAEAGLLHTLEPNHLRAYKAEWNRMRDEEDRKNGIKSWPVREDMDDEDDDEAFIRGVMEEHEACINME